MFPKIDYFNAIFPSVAAHGPLASPQSTPADLLQLAATEAKPAGLPQATASALAKPVARPTAATGFSFGHELELHKYLLARVVPHGNGGRQMTLMDTAALFETSSLTACTDAVIGIGAQRGLMDLRQAGVDWHVNASAGQALMKGFHPMNVIELNTHATVMPGDAQMMRQSERQIRAIDHHLMHYLLQPGEALVRLDDWVEAFNAAHPADLHLRIAADTANVHIVRGEHAREHLSAAGKHYYPQVNVSTTLEAWGDPHQSLDSYLA